MTKWYSPQLAHELVGRLYRRAKIERVPMTHVANRLLEKALDAEEMTECAGNMASDTGASGEHAGSVKSPDSGQPTLTEPVE
jgi:hypothetical protein